MSKQMRRPFPGVALRAGLTVALCAGLAVPAGAQSLTTNFGGAAEFSDQRNFGTVFDVIALHPQGITIQGFDVHAHAAAGEPVTVEVYTGGSASSLQDPLEWSILGRYDAGAAGHGAPTHIPAGGLHIKNGSRARIYINHVRGGVRFNSEAATTPVVANDDVRLEVGAVQELLFGGTLTPQRGWMGTLHYTTGDASAMGACCMPVGYCAMTTQQACEQWDGFFQGTWITCSGRLSCPPPSACCLPTELAGCVELQLSHCTALNGDHQNGWWCNAQTCPGLLHSRSWLINEIGTGFQGAAVSRAAGRNNVIGHAAGLAGGGPHYRLSDVFWVEDTSGWHVQSVLLYGIITAPATVPYSFPPQSPFSGGHVNIWDGVPDSPGSSIVATGMQMIDTGWTGIYRVRNEAEPDDASSPIMYVRIDLGDVHLPPGTYWVDYQLSGEYAGQTEVVTPPVVLPMQYPPIEFGWSGWQLTGVGWAGPNRSYPMLIEGQTGAQRCYANCDGSTTEPVLNIDDFMCFINEFATASSWHWFSQILSYANCDGSTTPPVLTVDDFLCFINEFAQGCP